VHTAIAFGEDDFRLGEQHGIKLQNPVTPDGTFDERVTDFAGRFVKDADDDIVEALRGAGRLLRAETYRHSYPHCWRCGTPLLYYAKSSWYIRTTDVRERMASRTHQAWPLRSLAGGERRLGPVARALLGHAAADLALRVQRMRRGVLRRLP
jgi:isoleucyl-tRNA synthetase